MSLVSSTTASSEWKFYQVFGERTPGEEVQNIDIISSIDFDKKGDYLATGDFFGRVVIFETTDDDDDDRLLNRRSRKELEHLDYSPVNQLEYRYKTEFQSHEPEFDYLKSVEIEEKINKVRWCTISNGSLFILSTNDKTIKLWRVKDRKIKKVKEMEHNPSVSLENALLGDKSFIGGLDEACVPNGFRLEWNDKAQNSTSQEGLTSVGYCAL